MEIKTCDMCKKVLLDTNTSEFLYSPWRIYHFKKIRDFCSNKCFLIWINEYFKKEQVINEDKLDIIFQKQKELQDKLGNTDIIYNQQYMNINFLALQCEIIEAMQETTWKNPTYIPFGWKSTQEFNKEKLKEELSDCLHFFINLCMSAGLSSQELFDYYLDKNIKNHERKENGY